MKHTLLLLSQAAAAVLLALVPSAVSAQTCPDPAALTGGLSLPLSAVRYLADDGLKGRLAGSDGERCAGDYVAREFARIGLKPGGENGTFFQSLDLSSVLNPHAPGGTGCNVIATLEGSDPELKRQWVVVGITKSMGTRFTRAVPVPTFMKRPGEGRTRMALSAK